MTKLSELTSGMPLLTDILPMSVVSSTIKRTATTITASETSNGYVDSANGFIAAGLAVGDNINVIGFTNTNNNVFSGRIATLTAGLLTVAGATGDSISNEGSPGSVTIAKWFSNRVMVSSILSLLGGSSGEPKAIVDSRSGFFRSVLTDAGLYIYHPPVGSNTGSFNWIIDTDAAVPYPIGTRISFDNDSGFITIFILCGDTLSHVNTTNTTGTVTLVPGQRVVATKVAATRWRIG